MSVRLINADVLDGLAQLESESVDSIVTDPPYALTNRKKGGSGKASINLDTPYGRARNGTGNGPGGFMGKEWDSQIPGVDIWSEAIRVLKPGGHLVAFGGTRTFHRLTCAIEDAGFEVRDCLSWLYGSGFPKSLDVSKAIDKAAGAKREIIGKNPTWRDAKRKPQNCQNPATGEDAAFLSAPATSDALEWSGWGTALKPAWEPIILARKPLGEKNVAANVLKHGTGAVNIDASRIGYAGTEDAKAAAAAAAAGIRSKQTSRNFQGWRMKAQDFTADDYLAGSAGLGRWPANLVLDEESAAMLDEQSGERKSGANPTRRGGLGFHGAAGQDSCEAPRGAESGGASRFFFTAKASSDDRDRELGNNHPTVKPVSLMRWLVRLVTPPKGTVLDPFMGSGSTGIAAGAEGFSFIGIEREAEYVAIAERRIKGPLFAEAEQ